MDLRTGARADVRDGLSTARPTQLVGERQDGAPRVGDALLNFFEICGQLQDALHQQLLRDVDLRDGAAEQRLRQLLHLIG